MGQTHTKQMELKSMNMLTESKDISFLYVGKNRLRSEKSGENEAAGWNSKHVYI